MEPIASSFSPLWPGIVGAITTGLLIYLSLRDVVPSRRHAMVLKWPPEAIESPTDGSAPSQSAEG